MKIIGAGLTGLIAGHAFRRYEPMILEAKGCLPDNHAGVLRLRSTFLSSLARVDLLPVTVSRWCDTEQGLTQAPSLWHINNYSRKVTNGIITRRSIQHLGEDQRWLAGQAGQLSLELSRGLDINFGQSFQGTDVKSEEPIISTIPMPIMAQIFERQWEEDGHVQLPFHGLSLPIYSCSYSRTAGFPLSPDCSFTVYDPMPGTSIYRTTLNPWELIIECMEEEVVTPGLSKRVNRLFGTDFPKEGWVLIKEQRNPFGKILPLPDPIRRRFIAWLTDRFNIYSLGRFATWTPGMVLDDLPRKIETIDKLINSDSYSRNQIRTK